MERTNVFQRKGERTPFAKERRNRKKWSAPYVRTSKTRRRFKGSVGIAGKLVINRRIAGQSHSSRVTDNQILLEWEMM